MKLKEAKKLIHRGVFYYTKQRGVVGTHWDEWIAAERVITELLKKEKRLKALRGDVKRAVEFLSRPKNPHSNREAASALLISALNESKR